MFLDDSMLQALQLPNLRRLILSNCPEITSVTICHFLLLSTRIEQLYLHLKVLVSRNLSWSPPLANHFSENRRTITSSQRLRRPYSALPVTSDFLTVRTNSGLLAARTRTIDL